MGFACPRPRNDHHRPFDLIHRLPLLGIQLFQDFLKCFVVCLPLLLGT